MLDTEFQQVASKLKGFGTENVGALLYALIRFCRPKSFLEVGAGYSTLFILKALKDNVIEDQQERSSDNFPYGATEYYSTKYEPVLICLDDSSHPESIAKFVSKFAMFLDINEFLYFNDADFRGFSKKIDTSILPLDFVWFDCGGLDDYKDFVNEYWSLVNPKGGIIVFHSTLTNLELQVFLKTLKLRQATSDFQNFELLSLLEPHKKIQNSVTVVRMTSELKDTIYTLRP